MPARVTLGTTLNTNTILAGDGRIRLASTSGVFPGKFLFIDGELMRVVGPDPDQWFRVLRGQAGTPVLPHVSGCTVYIGEGSQFYAQDPVGRPPETFEVSPWINVQGNRVWFAQGDNDPVGLADRWWQLQVLTRDVGALGVRTATPSPTSST
jgi:hypothetical protein